MSKPTFSIGRTHALFTPLLAVAIICGFQVSSACAQQGPYVPANFEYQNSDEAVFFALLLYHGMDAGGDYYSGHGTEQNWGEECYYSYSGGSNSTYSQKSGGGSRNSAGTALSGHSTTQNWGEESYYSYGGSQDSTYTARTGGK